MRAPSHLGQYMSNGEAHELPAFVGMIIFAAALRTTRRVEGGAAMLRQAGIDPEQA